MPKAALPPTAPFNPETNDSRCTSHEGSSEIEGLREMFGEGREDIVARRNQKVADVSIGEVISEYAYGKPVRLVEVMGNGVDKLFGNE